MFHFHILSAKINQMANKIPPLIPSSPPPLCECEDEDDDEFGMFTGVEDIDFTGKLFWTLWVPN